MSLLGFQMFVGVRFQLVRGGFAPIQNGFLWQQVATMKTIAVSSCSVRGVQKWRVRWHDERGKVRRKFFTSKSAAETHAISLRGQALSVSNQIAMVPKDERERMVFVWNEAKRLGVDLMAAIQKPSAVSSKAIGDIVDELLKAKRAAGRDSRYTHDLGLVFKQFTKGRERLPINLVTLADVNTFLHSKQLQSRKTFRGRLSTLFSFAVRNGYMEQNICARLESITVARKTPTVFTIKEVKKCLKWLRKNPRLFGWFVLSTFAGLRPEEAEQTTWADINFVEKWIRVEAQTTKIRQRRVVYPMPMVFDWLKVAKDCKTKMPFNATPKTRIRQRQVWDLRDLLGWKNWKHDVTRHTAASYWLAQCGSAATVATALGHSELTLKKNYMALVTKADAEKFWSIKP